MTTEQQSGHLVVRHKEIGITGVIMYPEHFFIHAGDDQIGMSIRWDKETDEFSDRKFLGDIYISNFEDERETDPFIKHVSYRDIEVIGLRVNDKIIKIDRLDRDEKFMKTCKDCGGRLVRVKNMEWYLRCIKCNRLHSGNTGNPLVVQKGKKRAFAKLEPQFYTQD